MKYTRTVLPNGLTILQVPSNDAESVVVDFFVKTGSRSETPQENGISHFLEHFLFKGTKKFPSSLAITELVDGVGGEMNANTGKEHTQYYIKAHSDNLPLIFEILTDMLQQPLLDQAELEREKGVIVEEINMYKDMPMAEIDNILEMMMWQDTPIGQGIIGTKDTVTKFNQHMFIDYMDRHYQTPNMILGVSGKFDTKEFNALVDKYWTPLHKKPFHNWTKVQDGQTKPRLSVQYKDTEQAHLSFGFKGFDFNDKRNSAATVLGAILGGGMSSRLFYEIRERRGLAYYVRSSSSNYQDTGVFHIGAGVQVDKIEEAITVILEELEKIKDLAIEDKELFKAKSYIKGRTTLALEDNQARLDWFIEQEAFHNKIQQPQELFEEIDQVTAKDVQKIAQFLFQENKLNLAVIGPYKSDKSFRKLLKLHD
jgi:predicted Zn-dependent peptidase